MTREETRAVWAERLADQQASGESITSWCWRHHVAEASFYSWRKRLAATTPPDAAPQWVAVTPEHGRGVTLRVGAVAVEVASGFDPRLLAEVLAVLEARR